MEAVYHKRLVPVAVNALAVAFCAYRTGVDTVGAAGIAFTVTAAVAKDAHPVLVCVNVNVGAPLATPDTTPALVTVANAVLLLVHVPPVVGDKVVVAPTHIAFAPVMLTTGLALIVTTISALALSQPLAFELVTQ